MNLAAKARSIINLSFDNSCHGERKYDPNNIQAGLNRTCLGHSGLKDSNQGLRDLQIFPKALQGHFFVDQLRLNKTSRSYRFISSITLGPMGTLLIKQ